MICEKFFESVGCSDHIRSLNSGRRLLAIDVAVFIQCFSFIYLFSFGFDIFALLLLVLNRTFPFRASKRSSQRDTSRCSRYIGEFIVIPIVFKYLIGFSFSASRI